MPHNHPSLSKIKDFPALVNYLRDELDWPIEEESFDNLTFEYTPDELGIKDDEAAKIKAIHQLRPLEHGQPWGIFFVEFEKKKLPVVVMRRILGALSITKRASANRAERIAFQPRDLLFVTAFGQEDHPEIAFAHFHHKPESPGDLPTLCVMGWDDQDTIAKLDHLSNDLCKLSWPDNPTDHDAWRKQWRKPFRLRPGQVIKTTRDLAAMLAQFAKKVRRRVEQLLEKEHDQGPLQRLLTALRVGIIHDLTEKQFADMFAQTVAYGLLLQRFGRSQTSLGGLLQLAVGNEFLRDLLNQFLQRTGRRGGLDFDEAGIQEIVDFLDSPDVVLEDVVRDFNNMNPQEDPVIHFYEYFLAEYNPAERKKRGVYYTPRPAVSYIVRSVHELLQTEFKLADGLASTITWGEMARLNPNISIPEGTSPDAFFVMVLDPATGTATFLFECIEVIHRHLKAKWETGGIAAMPDLPAAAKQGQIPRTFLDYWRIYVPHALMSRLYGYELQMAPYTIAQLKLALKLGETGYQFAEGDRLNLYLTNSLEPASDYADTRIANLFESLAHESQAVNDVKRNVRFTVVVGNPPYAVEGANKNPWIDRLMDSYRSDVRNEFNIQLLSDDYAKFIRFADNVISTTAQGVVAMITKNTYINTTAFRGLRKCLQNDFDKVCVLNLHGKLYEKTPEGDPDTNVFEIRVGVAILFTILSTKEQEHSTFQHSELYGLGDTKLEILSKTAWSNTDWITVPIDKEQWIMQPLARGEAVLEYAKYCALLDLAICTGGEQGKLWGGGVKTNRDFLLVAFTKAELESRLTLLSDANITTDEVKKILELTDGPYWNTERERKKLASIDWKTRLFQYLYGPFDIRWVAHIPTLIEIGRGGASKHVMNHFQAIKNVGLILKRRNLEDQYHHVFVTRRTSDINTLSGQTYTIPLQLESNSNLLFSQQGVSSSNFVQGCALAKNVLKTEYDIEPQEIFQYIYATLHSLIYRSRYGGELRKEFPRVPLTSSLELFRSLATLGGELVALHLLESPKVNDFITCFTGTGDNFIPKKPTWKDNAVWINPTQRFDGVPENVWNFYIGGYQVCEKWLKDRKGRTLSEDDIIHYQRIVFRLSRNWTFRPLDLRVSQLPLNA